MDNIHKLDQTHSTRIGRRAALKMGGVGIAGGLLMTQLNQSAMAQEQKPLGSWPDGTKGDSVFIGLTVPLTGPYSAPGMEQKNSFDLAAEHINNGVEQVRKISPLIKQGVLGKRIVLEAADSESKPNTAVQAAMRFIHDNKAIAIMGGISSAVDIAVQKVCNREHTVYLPVISGSDKTTGDDCQRYGFRLSYSSYMACKAIAPVLEKNLGKNRKAAYLTPDYTYGHSTFDSMERFTKDAGWTTVSNQVHPLGAKDYSSYLINIANTGADVLVVIAYGADAANAIKQAKQFGLLDTMHLVIPYMSAYLEEEVGAELMQGAYATQGFWWTMGGDNDLARDFVQAYQDKYHVKPRDSALLAYLALVLWADAVERAGSFYPPDVVKALEAGVVRESPIGSLTFRAEDHQGITPVPVLRGKKPAEMQGPDDYFEILQVVGGEETLPPLEITGCKLGAYV